mgnify:CR=1 FL=1
MDTEKNQLNWSGNTEEFAALCEAWLRIKRIGKSDTQVTVRLVRDYVARGILSRPHPKGKEVIFSYEHLIQFLACRHLLEEGYALKRIADDKKSMIEQGLIINTWGKNVYVKVPITNSKGKFMGKIIKELNKRNIKINITAVYTAKQTQKILKLLNKKTKVIISIFAGRAGDVGKDPLPEFKKSIKMAKKFKNVEILWASVREPYNYTQAKQLGCHIITIPPSIIEKIEKFGKSFDYLTTQTVKAFLADSRKSNFKI